MKIIKFNVGIFLFIFVLKVYASLAAVPGYLDSYGSEQGKSEYITATGWSGLDNFNNKTSQIEIFANNILIYRGTFTPILRQDVASTMGKAEYINSGWKIIFKKPQNLKDGSYEIKAYVHSGDNKYELKNSDNIKKYIVEKSYLEIYIYLIISIILLVGIVRYFYIKKISNVKILLFTLFSLFFILVSFGITGSSMDLLYKKFTFMANDNLSEKLLFQPQAIRSDEWMVFTPMAIGQYNHNPQFPVINKNLGVAGQNMLVVMGLIPINHITSIAKPITWGFYFFDLKRALAWQWWFPLFGALISLWWLLSILIPGRIFLAFTLSLLYCISPFSIAWSGWSQYIVFLPTIALASFLSILYKKNFQYEKLLYGSLFGLATVGFILFLYPPYIITIGTLYIILMIGIIIRDHKNMNINSYSYLGIFLGFLIICSLMYSWWIDAKYSIIAMQNTAYPGMRANEFGGGYTISRLLRGFSNPGSLYQIGKSFTNFSEVSSFYYFFLPLYAFIGLNYNKLKSNTILIVSLLLFITFVIYFLLFGINPYLAKIILWNYISNNRLDMVLGLACTLLTGFVFSIKNPNKYRLLSYSIAVIWGLLVIYALNLQAEYLVGFTPGTLLCLFVAIVFSGYFIINSEYKKYLIINLSLTSTAFFFNPISIGPNKVESKDYVRDKLVQIESPETLHKVIVIGNGSNQAAMALFSSGIPTINGILYYPQMEFWNKLGVTGDDYNKINRYQHLVFSVGNLTNQMNFLIENPSPDIVRVIFDGKNFNFKNIDAKVIAVREPEVGGLLYNPSIKLFNVVDGWAWFEIL